MEELRKYSNPETVYKKVRQLYGKDTILNISNRKDKKYKIMGEFTNYKWVHFGQRGYEDYTKHNDIKRRNNFRKRNNAWKNKPINSPAFLSYYLLW